MKNISFTIPSYNGEKTISKVIDSILKQDYKGKKEIIVVDDLSKDNSLEILKKYKKQDKIKLIINKKNIGQVSTNNKAVKSAKYDIVCNFPCDYVLRDKTWVKDMIKALNSNKNTGMVESKVVLPKQVWDNFGFWDKIVLTPTFDKDFRGKESTRLTVMFKKEALKKAGFYNDKIYSTGADTDLRLNILKKGYKLATGKTTILHYHGYYNIGFFGQLFKKAMPLATSAGVDFRRHGFLVKGNNVLLSTPLYLSLFLPYIRYIGITLLAIIVLRYTYLAAKYTKDNRIFLVPFFKLAKDIVVIIGFWKGFVRNKQKP